MKNQILTWTPLTIDLYHRIEPCRNFKIECTCQGMVTVVDNIIHTPEYPGEIGYAIWLDAFIDASFQPYNDGPYAILGTMSFDWVYYNKRCLAVKTIDHVTNVIPQLYVDDPHVIGVIDIAVKKWQMANLRL